jgi:penicillin-binding protein 1A
VSAKKNENSKKPKGVKTDFKKVKILFWTVGLLPLLAIIILLFSQSEDDLPSLEMLENPPELQASIVLADDGKTELGRYWQINRTAVKYKDISPFVTSALISTEDERFHEHSGVDFKSLGRAIVKMGGAGGGSTISQQLAKLLYTLKQREREDEQKSKGLHIPVPGKISRLMGRVNEKAQENIIATRLEERYTKEEIISMYLNQFDFLYNAVGIENAAKVYFNKTAKDLTKEEAATLVGMCKNPSLYNPYSYTKKNYRQKIASNLGIPASKVSQADINLEREKDSLRTVNRRNQVLYQWLRNSNKQNEALLVKITQEEYDELIKKPLKVDYHSVDFKDGIAPYFRESTRLEVTQILAKKDDNGKLIYKKKDGTAWNIYNDGLKIYTTINADLQQYAEQAVERHLKENLQPAFDKNNKTTKIYPFANDIKQDQIDKIMNSAIKVSDRYRNLKIAGLSESEILKTFHEPTEMEVFSWHGLIDTTMTPYDSIRYYKGFLRAGLMSIEPGTGFVKAWVGGFDMAHFSYDHVRLGKRQVGSTIKPFIYASGMTMGVVNPCTTFPNIQHCVDKFDYKGRPDGQWCPRNSDGKMDGKPVTVRRGLQNSMNNITVAIMQSMGATAGPSTVDKILQAMGIHLDPSAVVPAMCLGTMDLSLYELVAAQSTFVNNGIYIEPTTILRIEDRNGNVIYSARPKANEALNENVAYATLSMMQSVVNGGTAGSLRGSYYNWGGIKYPTAGKTGTTQSNSDGWFMGLTPNLVTGVWVGGEERAIRFRSMLWGQGARMALPIYGYYMQKAYANPSLKLTEGDFIKPEHYDESEFNCTPGVDDTNKEGESAEITI